MNSTKAHACFAFGEQLVFENKPGRHPLHQADTSLKKQMPFFVSVYFPDVEEKNVQMSHGNNRIFYILEKVNHIIILQPFSIKSELTSYGLSKLRGWQESSTPEIGDRAIFFGAVNLLPNLLFGRILRKNRNPTEC